MTRRSVLLAVMLAAAPAAARAQSADEVKALFQTGLNAIGAANASALWLIFDPSMPGYKQMRKDTQALLAGFEVTATVEFLKNENGAAVMNWSMEAVSRNGESSRTTRRVEVHAQVARKVGQWRVTSFTPLDLFAPPDVNQAWVAVATASQALAQQGIDTRVLHGGTGNYVEFLSIFDKSMPGYPDFSAGIIALARDFQVDSAVELEKNEGTDTLRTLVMDWTLDLISKINDVSQLQRHETVTCKLQKQSGHWRVISIEPKAFFAPPRP